MSVTPVQMHVGLVVSHSLVAKYLCDVLVRLQMNLNPVPLLDAVTARSMLPRDGQSVVLVDLHDLPLPATTYLDAFSVSLDGGFLALGQPREVSDIAHLLLSGFNGFLSYDQVPESLGSAIASVARGETWASPEVMRSYIRLTSHRSAVSDNGVEVLTKRESQILDLLQKRYSNKEIALFLGICESTVKFHVSNVLAKLNASGRRDLAQSVRTSLGVLPMMCRKCG
jgi:DNA-binding NarL/FixJ family response regulator